MTANQLLKKHKAETRAAMVQRHVPAGHVLLSYDDDDLIECETCLNRLRKKSFRQQTGRRYRKGEVINE